MFLKTMSELSERTRVPLGAVVSLVVVVISIVWFLARIDARLARIEQHVASDWMTSDQALWGAELARQNPSLRVPPVLKGGQ